jgi:hypothetical protein
MNRALRQILACMDKNPDLTLLNSTKTPQNLALIARGRQLTAPDFSQQLNVRG